MNLLYGDNLGSDQHQNNYQMLADVLHLEERLEIWKKGISPDLDLTTSSASTSDVCHKLAVILRLRYLNIRSLIHRSVLSTLLRNVGAAELHAHIPPSLALARKASLETCVESALETIDRIQQATNHDSAKPSALGAWWFTLYYSRLLLSQVTDTKLLTNGDLVAIDAALGLFAISLICYIHPQMVSLTMGTTEDWKNAIQQAIEALRRVDRGNKAVDRCRDCLTRLVKVLTRLSKFVQGLI